MSKVLYAIKMYLCRDEFPLTKEERDGLYKVCIFVVFIYTEYWFGVPLAAAAPNLDLQLIKSVCEFEIVNKDISQKVLSKFMNHLWYLNPKCVAISFFDNNVSKKIKLKMIEALKHESDFEWNGEKRYIVQNLSEMKNLAGKQLDYFINSH